MLLLISQGDTTTGKRRRDKGGGVSKNLELKEGTNKEEKISWRSRKTRKLKDGIHEEEKVSWRSSLKGWFHDVNLLKVSMESMDEEEILRNHNIVSRFVKYLTELP